MTDSGGPTWVQRPLELLVQIGHMVDMLRVPEPVIICVWRPDGAFQLTGTERMGVRAFFDPKMQVSPPEKKAAVLDALEKTVQSVSPDMIPFIECKPGKFPDIGALEPDAAKQDAARAAVHLAAASNKPGGSAPPTPAEPS